MVHSATSLARNSTELDDFYDVVMYIYFINVIILGLKFWILECGIMQVKVNFEYTLQSFNHVNDIVQGNNVPI